MERTRTVTGTKKLNDDHVSFIDTCLRGNNELTCSELALKIKEVFSVNVSAATISKERKKLGWKSGNTKYCQTIRHVNKPKRLAYALSCIKAQDNFHNVIFTDESTIKIQNSARRTLYKVGQPRPLKGKPKHPVQVHVWAGISSKVS